MELFTNDGGFARTNSAAVASVRGDIGGTLAESGRTTRPQWIFDYILTKGNLDTAYYTVIDNPIDEGDTYPSDHVPILAKIYLR
jgi:endonuclease/exonuclease/phosphatase family metal-dependent hydrolase